MNDGGFYDGKFWVDDDINPRKAVNHHRSSPKLLSVSPSIVANLTLLYYFLVLFPMGYVKVTMLPVMNCIMPEGDPRVLENYFIKWLGMWLVMGCYKGKWVR